ncbi:MAG: 1-deoxy-D-xylulose-5-phosphate reductoisomerase [Defluviitaleaceae bacterium]|nr:1-deoxy-D-xylulose-5-phosphate reductoisomerase [Defluviitaleaceae bacterium]
MKKTIAVLGATGSIGIQTLNAVRTCLNNVNIDVLTGYKNIDRLAPLVDEFKPEKVWVPDKEAASKLNALVTHRCKVFTGDEELIACAAENNADIVINALVGRAGLAPTLAAISAGKDIALANKETLVTAGPLVINLARKKNVGITPIDSEHSAIWQCLQDNPQAVEKILLTASGGPFRTWSQKKITNARAEDALRHPNWKMGAKITIDSATLMNKGLELIEAMHLFNQPLENIEILVHPQSIIHSMVQYHDGSVIAQLGLPDMQLPILYALSAPKRVKNNFPRLDFTKCGDLTFEAPNIDKFPCLALAIQAAKTGGTLPAVMNYMNEWAVGEFLKNKIGFYDISSLIALAFRSYTVKPVKTLADIQDAEAWAAQFIKSLPSTKYEIHV